ncbi:MAG: pilus assembly protein PilM [Chlamydiae bacterium]|nr:pilus assembly protein PilM [Chlamydiota bacterium]MBI3276732.1 pilus assembly protein PilM [Chlamydiota bacterium]
MSRFGGGWKNKFFCAIYLDQELLKIIIARSREEKDLELAFLHPIKGLSDEEIAAEIRKVIKKFKGKNFDFVLGLPRNLVTVKNLALPSIQREEMNSMVEFQVTRLVPHPRSEIVFDYELLSSLPNESSLVRLAVIHRKAIEHLISILSKANIHPQHIWMGSESLNALLPEIKEPTAILEVDYHQTNILFLKEGKIHFSRSIPLGTKDLVSKPEALSDFVGEVEASFALFPVDHEEEKEKIPVLLTGGTETVPLLKTHLKERLGFETRSFETPLKAKILQDENLSPQVSWAHLLALASSKPDSPFDLLPSDIRKSFENIIYKIELRKLFILLGSALLILCWVFMNELRLERNFLNGLKTKTRTLEPAASQLEVLRGKILLFKEHIEHRGDCLDLILSLLQNMTEGIYLKTITYDGSKISLRGYAPTLAKVFELTSLLQKNPLFQKIETRYARQVTEQREETAEFHLACILAKSHGYLKEPENA